MKIHGFDHVEYFVGDLAAVSAQLCEAYGFHIAGRSPDSGRRSLPGWQTPAVRSADDGPQSVLLRQGQINLLLTTPVTETDQAAQFLARHGDGIGVIAFSTDDVAQTYADLVAAGATPISDPVVATSADPSGGTVRTAIVAGFGDVVHKLVERSDTGGDFAPGVIEMDPAAAREERPGELLDLLDHVAVCLPAGELDSTVRFYRDVFGLAQIYDERIEVGAQGMLSKVVQDHAAAVTFTLIEPDVTREPGQIDEFLEAHDGAGVQHLAFRTSDIATAVREISARGVEFLVAPAGYYQALEGRLGKLAKSLDELRDLNVLADRDRWGEMFQIFARSTHQRHTLFIELIERKGALTFGSRNIRALYEALEDEHAGVTH